MQVNLMCWLNSIKSDGNNLPQLYLSLPLSLPPAWLLQFQFALRIVAAAVAADVVAVNKNLVLITHNVLKYIENSLQIKYGLGSKHIALLIWSLNSQCVLNYLLLLFDKLFTVRTQWQLAN